MSAGRVAAAAAARWNHNIHYHQLVLSAVPPGARSALDVGTGNGLLAADLRRPVADVTGIDVDVAVRDFALHLLDAVQHRWFAWRKGYWDHTAPTAPMRSANSPSATRGR